MNMSRTTSMLIAALSLAAPAYGWKNNRPTIVDTVNVVYAHLGVPTTHFRLGVPPPQADTPECAMAKAVLHGDVDTLDGLLEAGMDIDCVICLLEKSPADNRASYAELQSGQIDWSRRFFKQAKTTSLEFVVTASSIAPRWQWVGLLGDYAAREKNVLFTVADASVRQGFAYTLFGTPLMIACRAKNKYMVKQLLDRGANPNVFIQQKTVSDFSTRISARPWYYAIRALFGPADGRVDLPRKNDKTATEILRMLCDAGACLPPEDAMGRNALWDALEDMSPMTMDMALKTFDANGQDHQGKSFVDCLREYEANSQAMKNGRYVKAVCRDMIETLENRGIIKKDDSSNKYKHGDFVPARMPSGSEAAPSANGLPAQGRAQEPSAAMPPAGSRYVPAAGIAPAPAFTPSRSAPFVGPAMIPPAIMPPLPASGITPPRQHCPACRGSHSCRICKGTGRATLSYTGGTTLCTACKGTGSCTVCNGR